MRTNHDGDAKSFAERSIWTERMLEALETGSRKTCWYSLADKVFSERSLEVAADQVARNRGASGIDRMTIAHFNRARHRLVPVLTQRLASNTYQHKEVRRVWIPKPGKRKEKRPLGIPTVLDRIVQTAMRNGLEPIFEAQFHEHSYGFRPGRKAQDALLKVAQALRDGYTWIVDADLKSFFDTIDHDLLMDLIRQDVSDGRLLGVLEQMLKAGVVEEGQLLDPIPSVETGTPQGGVISPLLANIFLNDLDHQINKGEVVMIRYADDFLICCRSEEQAHAALEEVRQWTQKRKLVLHPQKTQVIDMSINGHVVEFLGFAFVRREDKRTGRPRYIRTIRDKSKVKLRSKLKRLTRRTSGHKLSAIIEKINPILRGFGGYFRGAIENELVALDQWVRMRLRSILRKRSKRKGRGRGRDHNRWPNAFFTEQGLTSLKSIRVEWLQSLNG